MRYSKEFKKLDVRFQLVKAVDSLLLNKTTHINFSSRVYLNNPGLSARRIKKGDGYYALYILDEPDKFFHFLETKPNNFNFDCFSVIPVIQYFSIYKVLTEVGFSINSILDLFYYASIDGGFSSIRIAKKNGSIIKHSLLSVVDKTQNLRNTIPYTVVKREQYLNFRNWDTFEPREKKLTRKTGRIEIGDTFHTSHDGVRPLSTYGNGDDWNGIVLQPNRTILKSQGFVLARDISKRFLPLADIAQQLLRRLPEHGINRKTLEFDEYQKRGGLKLSVAGTDYDKLMVALKSHLLGED